MEIKVTRQMSDYASWYLCVLMDKVNSNPNVRISNPTGWYPNSHPLLRLTGYKDVQVSQVNGIFLMFNRTFLSQFSNIIEIGSYNGGLTYWLRDNCPAETNVISYDIDPSLNTLVANNVETNIKFVVADCFADSSIADIATAIQSKGKTLLLCDGGNKPEEFNTFAKYLKSGDHIMVHDYSKTLSTFNSASSFWQWAYAIECRYESIEPFIETNGLIPHEHDAWEFFLWGSYVKK